MLKYELNKAGVCLAVRDIKNVFNGNAGLIGEYEDICRTLLCAAGDTKSRIKARKIKAAYNRLSEQERRQVAENKYVFKFYSPRSATVAQNRAKVMLGREMLKQFGLTR